MYHGLSVMSLAASLFLSPLSNHQISRISHKSPDPGVVQSERRGEGGAESEEEIGCL